MKRPDLEREQWQTAAAEIESTADDLSDQMLRVLFVQAAPVKEISEHANR